MPFCERRRCGDTYQMCLAGLRGPRMLIILSDGAQGGQLGSPQLLRGSGGPGNFGKPLNRGATLPGVCLPACKVMHACSQMCTRQAFMKVRYSGQGAD